MKPRNEHLNLIHKWLRYNEHLVLNAVFHNHKWNNVAIYGGGYAGELLYEQLVKTDIHVECIVDRNPNLDFSYDAKIITPDDFTDSFGELDAVIVTPIDYRAIKYYLSSVVKCPIISLHDIIVDIDDLRVVFDVVKRIEQSCSRLILCDLTSPVLSIKNPSLLELRSQSHGNNGSWNDFIKLNKFDSEFLLSFYEDLPTCNKEYVKSVYQVEYAKIIEKEGALYLHDYESKYINIINNSRYTTDNPDVYDNTIHFFGNCNAVGCFTEDKYTIQSQLQRMLNASPLNNKRYRVLNHSNWQKTIDSMKQILNFEFCNGDIIILLSIGMEGLMYYIDSKTVHFYDVNSAFDRPHGMDEIFFDMYHMNHRGYKLIANKIYSILLDLMILDESEAEDETQFRNFIKNDFVPRKNKTNYAPENSPSLNEYITLLNNEKVDCEGVIGSIVMNCNPFTLGHEFLISEATKQCDFLYVFVVEEDKSFISFADRLTLVKLGTRKFKNVKVMQGGNFIISSLTFPEYFVKDLIDDIKIDASKDIKIFTDNIAPVLNISKRFVGEEPFDPITHQYNQAMLENLPISGIEVIVIPRKKSLSGIPISASHVRKLLDEQNFIQISKIVPQTTLNYLESKFGVNGQ